uniref:Phospholysine phosphohistidine inorganic pyrophosphate phosphatase n=1 Tax=Dermatophagoides pteronyssinus TaxID=6956 RepID=A0A6P6XYQ1_DERPT|nr:phospholysine phosphohistidine inorganic pyrophosphate phosphatase-like [Dermatophagoides pteronyssinus]
MSPTQLSSSSAAALASKSSWLSKPIKGLLLDITGVLYESGTTNAINGSLDAISKLRHAGLPFRLVTNETMKITTKLIEKLNNFGYDFQKHEVITPGMICRQYLIDNNLRPHFLIYPDLEPEFDDIDRSNPNCVVIGDAEHYFTFERLNECFQLLMLLKEQHESFNRTNNLLISLGRNRYYRQRNELIMDLGCFTAALEYGTDLEAMIIGKPSKEYFQSAIQTFNDPTITNDNIIMIGDDIIGDVQGAQNSGIRGILVRTGKYLPLNENHPFVRPDGIVDNLADAVDQILRNQHGQQQQS